MDRVLIVPAPEGNLAKQLAEALNGAGYGTLEVESCELVRTTLERDVGDFFIVVVCDMWAQHEDNASWLADMLTRHLHVVSIIIITDESPAAIIYREAELTGAVMILRTSETNQIIQQVLDEVDLAPKKPANKEQEGKKEA